MTAEGQSLPKRPGRWLARLHFVIRFLGLTGLLVACVGLVLAGVSQVLTSWGSVTKTGWTALQGLSAASAIHGDLAALGANLAVWGLAAALFALLIEILVVLRFVATRRSAFGTLALLQVILAVLLLVGVNVFSATGLDFTLFGHTVSIPARYARMDWTRSHQFTLPEPIRKELDKLQDETTIVVYLQHKTFGTLNDKPDKYDYAAERKVVEKVKDLVAQFREAGPEFKVVVLDVEEEGFDEKLASVTENAPLLAQAIEEAPENSIFFHVRKRAETPEPGTQRSEPRTQRSGVSGPALNSSPTELVQRLSFNQFYRLDKTASEQANEGRGNLVLLAQGSGTSGQGAEALARTLFNLDQRKPRVGIAVIHPFLTTRGPESYGLGGLKETLTRQGFEVQDIILLKEPLRIDVPPTRTVTTYEERDLDRLDRGLEVLGFRIRALEQAEKQLLASYPDSPDLAVVRALLDRHREQEKKLREQRSQLDEESILEQRRMTDYKTKLKNMLSDCDLLILPRPTLHNLTAIDDRTLPLWLHNVGDDQASAIRDFLREGKPILALFGPINERPEPSDIPPQFRRRPAWPPAPDKVEKMLSQLGIRFSRQTVLFDAENQAFGEQRLGLLQEQSTEEVPPLLLDWAPGLGRPPGWKDVPYRKPHPIQQSLRIAARSLGPKQKLQLRVRHPRPIYFVPSGTKPPAVDPEFLRTSRESWNEDAPFPDDNYAPTYRGSLEIPPDATASLIGALGHPTAPRWQAALSLVGHSLDFRRRGPFPIAVAVEVPPPKEWYSKGEERPDSVRVAAIGQTWFLIGSQLNPAEQQLVLDTCNWLLRRDDRLARDDHPWSFPRSNIEPDSTAEALWEWGTRLGLPVLFAYLGLVVLLIRRLR